MTELLLDTEVSEHSITAFEVTAGAAEQSLSLSLDGSAPALTVAVGPGVILLINDFLVSGEDPAESRFRLQQANDGVTFFDIALARVGPNDSNHQRYQTPLRVNGGPLVRLQVRAETVTGAAQVGVTVRAAQMIVSQSA